MTGNVSFNIASEASYVYILSGQKFIKNSKKWSILASFWKPEAVKQCYQKGEMKFSHNYLCALNQCSSSIIISVHWGNVAKCDIFDDFQTRWRSSSLGKFPLFSIVTFSTFALAESFIGVALEFAEASQIEWQSPAKNWTMKYLGFLPFSSPFYSAASH